MPTHQINPKNLAGNNKVLSKKEIENWITSYIANLLEVEPRRIDITVPFDRYGLDSSIIVGMIGDLEDVLCCNLPATLVYDYPTIQSLVKHLDSLSN